MYRGSEHTAQTLRRVCTHSFSFPPPLDLNIANPELPKTGRFTSANLNSISCHHGSLYGRHCLGEPPQSSDSEKLCNMGLEGKCLEVPETRKDQGVELTPGGFQCTC